MHSKRSIRVVALFLSLLAWILPACDLIEGEQEASAFEFAVIAPFGDEYGSLGQSVRNGVLLAVEAQNERGGVLGQPVRIILEDSACDYQTARAAAQSVIADEGVVFILGAVCADASEGVAQIASEAGVLQISPASVDADLTEDAAGVLRPLVFRTPVTDPDQGIIAARFAVDTLGAETAGILYAEQGNYGSVLVNAFTAAFEAEDGEVIARETYDQNASQFYEMLEPIREADPDVLYLPGYHSVINQLLSQVRTFGMFQPVIGSDGWKSSGLDLNAADNSYFPVHYLVSEPRSIVATWSSLYEARYLVLPDTLATLSYDTANVLFAAVEAAGYPDPYRVSQILETSSFDTVSGSLTFDDMHNPIKSMAIVHIDNGLMTFEERRFAQPPEDDAPDNAQNEN